MKIYTKAGDQGKTRLVDGSCVEKFNPRVEAYGTLDELNSYIGLIRSLFSNSASNSGCVSGSTSTESESKDPAPTKPAPHESKINPAGNKNTALQDLAKLESELQKIQNKLFVLGGLFACEKEDVLRKLPQIKSSDVEALEKAIDLMEDELEPLRNFILPTGELITAHLHVARTICRRSERRCAEVQGANGPTWPSEHPLAIGLIFLNRLSDFLFVAARWNQRKNGLPEVLWKAQLSP